MWYYSLLLIEHVFLQGRGLCVSSRYSQTSQVLPEDFLGDRKGGWIDGWVEIRLLPFTLGHKGKCCTQNLPEKDF